MQEVFQEIRGFKCSAMVDIWYLPEHKAHPVKCGRFDIMYGPSVMTRHKIALPLTEVTAVYNVPLERWEYIYGGGWDTRKTIPLSHAYVWY